MKYLFALSTSLAYFMMTTFSLSEEYMPLVQKASVQIYVDNIINNEGVSVVSSHLISEHNIDGVLSSKEFQFKFKTKKPTTEVLLEIQKKCIDYFFSKDNTIIIGQEIRFPSPRLRFDYFDGSHLANLTFIIFENENEFLLSVRYFSQPRKDIDLISLKRKIGAE